MKLSHKITLGVLILICGLLVYLQEKSALAEVPLKVTIKNITGGIDTNHAPDLICNDCAQYIQNIQTDEGGRRREGDRFEYTLGGTGTINSWTFVDINNNEWYIKLDQEGRLFAKTDDLIGSIELTTNPFSNRVRTSAAKGLGKIFFSNKVDGTYSWNGSTFVFHPTAPKAGDIEIFRNRVVLGDLVGDQSSIQLSGELDPDDYTNNPDFSTSPIRFRVGGVNDGQKIQWVQVGVDELIMAKKQSLWALYGFDQTDFRIRQISNDVGSIYPDAVSMQGTVLKFVSNRGIEIYTPPFSIQRISENIQDQLLKLSKSELKINSTIMNISTLVMINGDFEISVPNDQIGNGSNWRTDLGMLFISTDGTAGSNDISDTEGTCAGKKGFRMLGRSPFNNDLVGDRLRVKGSTIIISDAITNEEVLRSTFFFNNVIALGSENGCNISTHHIDMSSLLGRTVVLRITMDTAIGHEGSGNLFSQQSSSSTRFYVGFSSISFRALTFHRNVSTKGFMIDDIEISTTSFIYQSTSVLTPSFKDSWGIFSASYTVVNDTPSFKVLTSTSGTIDNNEFSTQTNNSLIVAPIEEQYIATRWIRNSSSTVFGNITVSWNEAKVVGVPLSLSYKDRWYLFFTTSTDSRAINDRLLIHNRFNVWDNYFPIYAGGASIYKDQIRYSRSDSSSNTYSLEADTTTSSTSPTIFSTITLRRICDPDYDMKKTYDKIYLTLSRDRIDVSSSQIFRVEYAISGSTNFYTAGNVEISTGSSFLVDKVNIPISTTTEQTGNCIDVIITEHTQRMRPFRFHGARIYGVASDPD